MRVIPDQVLKAFFFAALVACTASAESPFGAGAEILDERNSAAAPAVAIASDLSTMAISSSVSSRVDTFSAIFTEEEGNGVSIRGYLSDGSHSSAKVRKGNEFFIIVHKSIQKEMNE